MVINFDMMVLESIALSCVVAFLFMGTLLVGRVYVILGRLADRWEDDKPIIEIRPVVEMHVHVPVASNTSTDTSHHRDDDDESWRQSL